MKTLIIFLLTIPVFAQSYGITGNPGDPYKIGSGGGGAGNPCTSTALSLQYNASGSFGCVAGITSDGTNLTGTGTAKVAIQDKGGQVYNVLSYGVVAGDVDSAGANSTAMLALLATVNTAGGGTIYFPPGTYRFDSQMLLPNDGASPQQNQNNIRITGAGGGAAWYTTDAAILDLRYVSGNQNAKIETRGRGTLQIDNLTIKDGGASNVCPMVHTTNTTLIIDNNTFIMSGNVAQDAIVLGGTSVTLSTGVNSPFQGYVTRITSNHFRNGNRALYGLTFANAVLFQGNSFQANTGTVAIEFDGSNGGGNIDYGSSIRDNTIEMDIYTYGIKGTAWKENLITGNQMHDPGSVTSYYNLTSGSTQNVIVCGTSPSTKTFLSGDAASKEATTVVCSESGMNDSSGNGPSASTFSYNATVKGTYDSTQVYAGALNVAVKDSPNEVVSIGYDHTNGKGVITSKNNVTKEPLFFDSSLVQIPSITSGTLTTAGGLLYDTTNKNIHAGANGVDNYVALLPSANTIANSDCVEFSVVSSVVSLKSAGSTCGSGGGGTSIGGAVTSGTTASVLFVASGPVLAQDNANFNWDGANHRLGIGGGTSAAFPLDVTADSGGRGFTVVGTNGNLEFRSGGAQQSMLISVPSSTNGFLIGTTNGGTIAGSKVRIQTNSADAIVIDSSQVITFATPPGASAGDIPACISTTFVLHTAAITCGTSVLADKFDVADYSHGLDYLMSMRPVEFNVRGVDQPGADKTIGFIADEMANLNPLLASYVDGKLTNYRDRAVLATLVKAVQELNAKVDAVTVH